MAAEKLVVVGGGGGGGAAASGGLVSERGEEMNGNGSSKMVLAGGGAGGGAYRWNGDAVPLKRRRVGLSNGASVSDAESSEEEEEEELQLQQHEEEEEEDVEEDAEEVPAEEYSDEYEEEGGAIPRSAAPVEQEYEEEEEEVEEQAEAEEEEEEAHEEEEEEEEEEEDPRPIPTTSMDRHRVVMTNGRGRELVTYHHHEQDVEMDEEEDEGYEEEEPTVPESPVARVQQRGRGREREIVEVSSPEEMLREASDESDEEERFVPPPPPPSSSRINMIERGQSSASEIRREVMVIPEKPSRGMTDTAKRKAEVIPRSNGVAVKPKKEKAPAAPKRKANGEAQSKERTPRFSTDNKARVTLERAREILAAVKAAMMKDPKQFSARHSEPQPVHHTYSSSEDDRKRAQHQQPRAIHQVKTEEKVVKKRSRPPKGDKEPTPRKRKPKVEIDYHHAAEDKFYRGPQGEISSREQAYKLGHFATSGVEVSREDDRNGYARDGYDQQITVVEKKVRKRRKVKEEDAASATGLCPGSVLRDENWAPPASPFGLIQESLYKDPWKVLLSCMLLNKTAGRQFLVQMHKVIWDLFSLCPDAETAINMDTAKIAEKVYSLGLQNKRAKMIQRFSLEYSRGDWTNVTQLHGIGKYAADAYAIFCQGLWREVQPDDLMLNKYWKWLWETDGLGSAFTPDTS